MRTILNVELFTEEGPGIIPFMKEVSLSFIPTVGMTLDVILVNSSAGAPENTDAYGIVKDLRWIERYDFLLITLQLDPCNNKIYSSDFDLSIWKLMDPCEIDKFLSP